MKKFILSFIISTFIIWPGVAHAQNILPIGDSLTLGYVKYLTTGFVLTPVASVGARSEKILNDVRSSLAGLEAGNPEYVFILLGTNDAPGFVDPEPVKQNILDIVKLLRRADRKIYVSTLPPIKALNSIGKINAKIVELGNEVTGIVDQSEITVDMLTDGIHPNEDGYKIIACNFLRASGLKPDCVKPKIIPKANIPAKIPTRGKKCPSGDSLGFAPLRPDPGEPCEEFVPVDTAFACGSSITPLKQESFSPYGDGCDKNTDGTVTCYKAENFDISLDLSKANLGILGNTQDQNLTNEQKVNEYLSWYLSGVTDKKLVDFAGPIRKLIPYDLSYLAKETIINQNSKTVHNYKVGEMAFGLVRANLSDFAGIFSINRELFKELFQNIPFSSLEDTVGEYVVSATDLKRNNLQDPNVLAPGDKGFQVPVKLTITNTSKAP